RDRDGRRHEDVCGRRARRYPRPRRAAGAGRSQGLRRTRAHLDARRGVRRSGGRGEPVTAVLTIAGYGLREALRRKVFVVVLLLTVAFLLLYWIGKRYTFRHVGEIVPTAGIVARTLSCAFLFGLARFG